MRIERLRGKQAAGTNADTAKWKEAYLTRSSIPEGYTYAALLALQADPSKRLYTQLQVQDTRVFLDIPLIDRSPNRTLAERAYAEATFFGEVDQERYRRFATDTFRSEQLFALLNRESAGVGNAEIATWFYTTFRVEHLKPYGDLFVGSHGGSTTFFATLENRNRMPTPLEDPTVLAAAFGRKVLESLPHVSLNPLPVNSYLQDLQPALRFLPKDWYPEPSSQGAKRP